MRFSTIFTAAIAFGFAAAQATVPEQIIQTFKEVTTMSDNLRIETQKINLVNAPLQGYVSLLLDPENHFFYHNYLHRKSPKASPRSLPESARPPQCSAGATW